MTYTVHLLLYLAAIRVQNLGLLCLHDTFGLENENRLLLKSKTSPTHVAVQVVKCFLFYKSILTFSFRQKFPTNIQWKKRNEKNVKCLTVPIPKSHALTLFLRRMNTINVFLADTQWRIWGQNWSKFMFQKNYIGSFFEIFHFDLQKLFRILFLAKNISGTLWEISFPT